MILFRVLNIVVTVLVLIFVIPLVYPQEPVRFAGDHALYQMKKQVAPKYPLLAKKGRIQVTVTIDVTVDKDGKPKQLQVAPGAHPLLVPAAMEAVRQWRWPKFKVNNEPVEVETSAVVNFVLDQ
jgi:protein TonB